MKKITTILVLAALLSCWVAQAEPVQLSLWNPIQLFPEQSSVDGLRLNLLYGKNEDVAGLDMGLVNGASRSVAGLQIGCLWNDVGAFSPDDVPGEISGIQIGGLANTAGSACGLQMAGLLNVAQDGMMGGQFSLLCNYVKTDANGVQFGSANIATGRMNGGQIAVTLGASANLADSLDGVQFSVALVSINKAGRARGMQFNVGLLGNHADDMSGVQISAICNSAGNMKGLQIGAVNYCERMSGMQIGLVNIITTSPAPFLPIVNASF